jgi:multiple sugar transport system permease protein
VILGRRRTDAVAQSGAVARRRPVAGGRDRSRERWFYLLIAPWLFGLVVLQILPMLAAGGLAFAEWEPPLAPRWVGLDNLAELLADPRFATAVLNTLVYGIATVVPGLAIGLGLALLLGPRRRGGTVLRTTVFLPAIVAGVATALMWGWVFNARSGLIDGLLGIIGLQGPAWLRDPAWAMPAMVVIGLWNVGVNVIVYIAALGTVPRELHDAAALDGAGARARFRYVTWPALLPVTFYLAIVNAIAASQIFTPSYVLTRGGPDDATLTTALYTYQTAFAYGRLGYAAAMAMIVFLVVLLLTAIQFRVVGRRVPYLGADA